MKKILCINPPAGKVIGKLSRDGRCQSEEGTWTETFPPTTLASIAGHIRSKNHIVKLIDCIGSNISWHNLKSQIKDFSPDVVIINTVTPTIKEDLNVARITKQISNSIITAAYGTMPSAMPQELKKWCPELDFSIRGDPETPALNIVEGRPLSRDIWIEEDLDSLGLPAYELLPTYQFPLNGKRWTFLIDGKGCPYRCIYCVEPVISKRKARYKSIPRVIEEIDCIVNKYHFPFFMFWDELFTLNIERSKEICEKIIKLGLNKKCQWMITTRVDKADKELFTLMKQAGCWMVVFGIESGNQKVLDSVKKDITLEQSRMAVNTAYLCGLKTVGHFIMGLPGSNVDADKDTIDFALSLPLNFAQFYCCTAFPGSELYDIAVKNGYLSVDSWDYIEQGTANIGYPHYNAQSIQHLRRAAYNKFYWRYIFFIRFLNCLSINGLIQLIPRGLRFIRWMKK
jgi:radical SAM superfamily enzyme YgiQ (UPF0313 family)